MVCKKPFIGHAGVPFGCGQCLPCRVKDRRVWMHRLLLESFTHGDATFATLTYESVPDHGTLVPAHTQSWIKRLRSHFPGKIRYFLVGEYGDDSERPHYHAILFGYPTCLRGRTDHRLSFCCPNCELIKTTWTHGGVDLRGVGKESIQYVCGYVLKKLNGKNERSRALLAGRHPEFARMSNRPGIGAPALPEIVQFVTQSSGCDELLKTGDVPSVLRHGSKLLPLGRYLRQKTRLLAGLDDEKIRAEGLKKFQQEMSKMLETSFENPKNKSKSYKKILLQENEQKILNVESKQKLFKKKGQI